MDSLKSWGIHYISNREIAPNDAVMFDIDDTLIIHPKEGSLDYNNISVNQTFNYLLDLMSIS